MQGREGYLKFVESIFKEFMRIFLKDSLDEFLKITSRALLKKSLKKFWNYFVKDSLDAVPFPT